MANNGFETITLSSIEALHPTSTDELPFGVVGFNDKTTVETYNATEAKMAGLDPADVIGVPFFEAIGQCMNNFMVAQRFEDEQALDEVIPYILTLRMRPTRVRLRLLKAAGVSRRYILIER